MSYFKYYKNVEKGNITEALFKKTAIARGYDVADATLEENKYSRYDFIIYKQGRCWMIDCKHKSDGIVVEYKNCFGYNGWAQIDSKVILALQYNNTFVMVKVSDLRLFADSKITDKTVYESTNPKEYYKLYTRSNYGHSDLFMVLPISDLEFIKHTTWEISDEL